ncbi:MAG: choice-of-anchor D domain-containing protein [Alphaproteobacteria bacterium]|nr:choice-of-anchor D domain-containing protein [Alphaproteobacteria bacterium]
MARPIRSLFVFAIVACVLLSSSNEVRAQSAFDDPSAKVAGGAGGLIPVNPSVDGGAIPIGASAQIVVLFRNEGGRPVQTGEINLYPSSTVSASVALNQCSREPLPPGAECAIALSVKGLQPGPWRTEMLMRHDGRTRLVTATLAGTVDGTGDGSDKLISDVEAIPDELDFGSLSASRTLVKSLILRNITSTPIDIDSITIEANPSAGYSLRTDCTRLEAGQACIATVTWAPLQEGPATGVIVVDHNGPTGVVSVNLEGEYTPEDMDAATIFPKAVPGRGLLVASQEDVDFGADISSKSSITVSLVNVGDAPLVLEDLRLSGRDNGLAIEDQGCTPGMILEPIQACPLTLSWAPVRAGTLLDDVQIMHNGARGILVIPARGTAESAVSQDSQAIYLSGSPGLQLDASELGLDDDDEPEIPEVAGVNKAKALDGFVITSFAPTRAIIAGPGGSRVVFGGEEVVIGGVLWEVVMRKSGVEFRSGKDKVLLLFDRSLSSINRATGQSGDSGSGAGASGAAPTTAVSTTSTTTDF